MCSVFARYRLDIVLNIYSSSSLNLQRFRFLKYLLYSYVYTCWITQNVHKWTKLRDWQKFSFFYFSRFPNNLTFFSLDFFIFIVISFCSFHNNKNFEKRFWTQLWLKFSSDFLLTCFHLFWLTLLLKVCHDLYFDDLPISLEKRKCCSGSRNFHFHPSHTAASE